MTSISVQQVDLYQFYFVVYKNETLTKPNTMCTFEGAYKPADTVVLVHESPGCGYMAVRTSSLHVSIDDNVRCGEILTIRMA